MDLESKVLDFECEMKASKDRDDGFFRFEGLASTFKKDLVDDVIEKGAFKESIGKQLPKILFQHDQTMPIGVTEEIKETGDGLFIKAKLPVDDDLVKGRIIPQMKVGSLTKLSIGFRMSPEDSEVKNGIRHIKKVDLHEVSIVTFPANTGAQITAFKNIDLETLKNFNTRREFEDYLRESGVFSRSAATYIAKGWTCNQRDSDTEDSRKVSDKLDDISLCLGLDTIINKIKSN